MTALTAVRTYRVLVTGSRALDTPELLHWALTDTWHDITQLGGRMLVVQGACYPRKDTAGRRPMRSADWLAHLWCQANGVPDEEHPSDWGTCTPLCPDTPHLRYRADGTPYCPVAGCARNQHMVDLGADVCIACPVGRSPGTRDCIRRARAAGIPVRPVTDPRWNPYKEE